MATLFTKIINGEIPCHKILEDENFFAFLDINPIREGHTLVIPKKEIDYIFDIEDDVLGGLMAFSKRVAAMIENAIPCKRIGVMICGLEIPHAHVHLIPMQEILDLNFQNAKPSSSEELKNIAGRIVAQGEKA